MKVITLTAPWAWLVAGRLKGNETRGWKVNYRGLIGIHVGQSLAPVGGPDGLLEICARPWFREAMIALGIPDPLAVQRGRIIAVANLRDIQPVEHVRDQLDPMELAFGDYTDGRFAWQLDGAAQLTTPIVTPGKQGLWSWNEDPALYSAAA